MEGLDGELEGKCKCTSKRHMFWTRGKITIKLQTSRPATCECMRRDLHLP